jgi:hypothetical protein
METGTENSERRKFMTVESKHCLKATRVSKHAGGDAARPFVSFIPGQQLSGNNSRGRDQLGEVPIITTKGQMRSPASQVGKHASAGVGLLGREDEDDDGDGHPQRRRSSNYSRGSSEPGWEVAVAVAVAVPWARRGWGAAEGSTPRECTFWPGEGGAAAIGVVGVAEAAARRAASTVEGAARRPDRCCRSSRLECKY